MVKKIAIGTLKGGVGKTTIAVTLATILAQQGNNVLLIDADPQANSTNFLGMDETVEEYTGIHNIFKNTNVPPITIVNHTDIDNLDIIGSSILLTASDKALYKENNSEKKLKDYLDKNKDFFGAYDYIIFDTNPSMSMVNQNVFVAADKIICVSDVGIGGFKGIELFDYMLSELSETTNLSIKVDAIILNKVKKVKLAKEYLEFLQEEDLTKKILIETTIKDSIKFAEAELNQKPINIYAKNSKSSSELQDLVEELIKKGIL